MSAKNTTTVAWTVLLVSAVLEAVWATALGASDGLSNTGPTVLFVVALTLSMLGLGYAARSIPISTAYAIWTGIGAALTVGWAMATGTETVTALSVLFLAGIVGCAIGLRLVSSGPVVSPEPRGPRDGAASAPQPGPEA